MSDDSTSETEQGPTAKIEELDERIPEDGVVFKRLSAARSRIAEYKAAEGESERADLREQIESELEEVRTAIESELDEGKEKAHGLVDDIESRLSRLWGK
ncbi:hypothetical protein [Haloplanus halobius]|uniref:hypothetical protein n=1 Tax=Haloplanus halobius TaxID=2934938 RepID=UPI0020102FF3|nr:hypothetical protein [Haloplanus sp. XH21]